MARIDDLVYHLQGTCKFFKEGCRDLGIDYTTLTQEELEGFDDRLFCCGNCGWWYDTGERAGIEHPEFCDSNICIHCAPEFEDNGYEEY